MLISVAQYGGVRDCLDDLVRLDNHRRIFTVLIGGVRGIDLTDFQKQIERDEQERRIQLATQQQQFAGIQDIQRPSERSRVIVIEGLVNIPELVKGEWRAEAGNMVISCTGNDRQRF